MVSADAIGIKNVLNLLDKQGISYYLLEKGTSLKLKQYDGQNQAVTLGDVKDIIFENGAYIFPVDGYRANMIAILFEPEYPDTANHLTFVEMGHLAASDIYRCEESFIAAKLGLAGTYKEVAIPADKTVASVVVNGVTYDSVDTEGENAYVNYYTCVAKVAIS